MDLEVKHLACAFGEKILFEDLNFSLNKTNPTSADTIITPILTTGKTCEAPNPELSKALKKKISEAKLGIPKINPPKTFLNSIFCFFRNDFPININTPLIAAIIKRTVKNNDLSASPTSVCCAWLKIVSAIP